MLNGPLEAMEPGFFSALADRTEDALATTKAQLNTLGHEVREALHQAFVTAPEAVKNAVLGDKSAPTALIVAYHLGSLSFAQLLIDQTLTRRADDDFAEVVNAPRNRAITQFLLRGDEDTHRLPQLMEASGLDEAETRQRIRELIDKGAVDFRKWSGVMYFLTHAGKAAAAACNRNLFEELVTGPQGGPLTKALAEAQALSATELATATELPLPDVQERIRELQSAGAIGVLDKPVTLFYLTLAGKAAVDAARV